MSAIGFDISAARPQTARPGKAAGSVTPERILGWLLALVALVVAAGAISAIVYLATQDPDIRAVCRWFMLDVEGNPPTFVSYGLLVLAAALCALAAARRLATRDRWRWHWLVLAAVFLLLGYDEAAQVHESLGALSERLVTPTGLLTFSWVVVVAPLPILLGLAYLPFLWALPRRTALVMVAAGLLFLGGAVGMEMVGGMLSEQRGQNSVRYQIVAGLEESLELLGVTLFVYAVLRCLTRPEDGRVQF